MEPSRLTVESRDAFVFAACCSYLDLLGPKDACVVALRPRDPDFTLFTMARGAGTVSFNSTNIRYRVESTDPVATDSKPEKYHELVLETDGEREVLLHFVSAALTRHRLRVTEPRGLGGSGVMRFVWDDATQTWDSGKLVPRRPLSTLFLRHGVAEDLQLDLDTYLRPETKEVYAALHVSPIRVYLFHGSQGGGKTSLIHCLASETGNNLATLSFHPHTTDDDLRAALRSLPDRCFLCLEDVDCLFEDRKTKNHGVTFSSFLAALDGTFTAQPLTLFLTTNFMKRLDPALRRRVDYVVEFTEATREQCKKLFLGFYPGQLATFDTIWATVGQYTFSMSVFQKYLVRSLPSKDPLRCLDIFQDLVAVQGLPQQPHAYYS